MALRAAEPARSGETTDAYDIEDKESYFMSPTGCVDACRAERNQVPGSPPGGTPPSADTLGQGMNGGGPAVGQTNPGLAAGPTAPSNGLSLSPASMMQQSLAKVGGGRSA
jgi:hypothetical protein